MARSSRSSRSSSARTSATANDPLRSLLGASNSEAFASPSYISTGLEDVQDGRRFHPEDDDRPNSTVHGGRTWSVIRVPRLIVHRRPVLARHYYTNVPVGLQVPIGVKRVGMFPVVTCVRRAIRKSVLFATGRRAKGSGAKRRHKSYSSHVSC